MTTPEEEDIVSAGLRVALPKVNKMLRELTAELVAMGVPTAPQLVATATVAELGRALASWTAPASEERAEMAAHLASVMDGAANFYDEREAPAVAEAKA